jgi:hypothetical protein
MHRLYQTVAIDFIHWMALVELVHSEGSHRIPVVPLITKSDLFTNNPNLTIFPSRVQSAMFLEDFRDFVSDLEDKSIDIKGKNIPGLSQLSEEFGFQALLTKLSADRWSPTDREGSVTNFSPERAHRAARAIVCGVIVGALPSTAPRRG